MKKEFLLNLAFLITVNLLVKPLYIFGIDVGVQNVVGDQYGSFFALVNFAYIFQFVADLGIQQFNNRQIAQKSGDLGKLFPQLFMTKLLLITPYFLIAYLFAWLLGMASDWKLLLIVLLNQIIISLSLFIRSNISGLGMYRRDSYLSITDKLFMILACGAFLIFPQLKAAFSIYLFASLQTVSFLIVILIGLWFLKGHEVFKKFKWQFQAIRPLIKKSIPFGITVLLMTMYTRIDAVMIKSLLVDGAFEAQVYAGGYRLLDAANMFAFLFAPLLLPMFAKLMQTNKDELRQLLKMSLSLMWVLVVSASIPCYIYKNEIMSLLYIAADQYWGNVFGVLILNFIWMGLIYIFGTYITARGRMKEANIVFGICILFNILLNAMLIPDYKAWGAAIATLLTHGGVVVGLIWIMRSQLINRYMARTLALFLIFLAGSITLNWGLWQWVESPWGIRFILSILCCGVFALILRLVDLRSLKADFLSIRKGR